MELRISEAGREDMLEELKQSSAEGMVWAAFNERPYIELNRFDLRFFETQEEAEEFCEEATFSFLNPYEDDMGLENWRYVPLRDLEAYVLGIPESYLGLDLSAADVAAKLSSVNLHLLHDRTAEQALDHFQNGRVFPVVWMKEIDPLRDATAFYIAGYQHTSPFTFGHGHNLGILSSFDNFADARAALDISAAHSKQAKDDIDYLLIGGVLGQKPVPDIEGHPASHTGFVLDMAYWKYDIGLAVTAWQVREPRKADEPVLIQKEFFTAYDRFSQTIQVLNGKLEPVQAETSLPISYPRFYKDNLLTTKNQKIMTQESFEFTRDQLKNLGFGDEIAEKLHTAMDQNLAEFQLEHSREFGKDVVNSVLHFSKGDEKDYTFFNRFDATLKQEGKEDLTQTFFIGPKYNYTLQERYNMMDGRSVYREQPKMEPKEGENGETKMKPTGETYTAWRGLDFKLADKYGNFLPKVIFWDHEKELQKYPIKNIEEKYDRRRLMRPLEKGNKVNVTLLRDGVETPAQVVANPRMMRLDFYDTNGQSLIVRRVEKQAVDQTQKVEQTPQQIQQAAIAREAMKQQEKNGQAPGQGQDQQVAQAEAQKEAAKNNVAEEQQNNQGSRKRQGVRV
jgi:hypothetical protein